MSSSREESPDWLRSFKPPDLDDLPLSSESESPGGDSDDEDRLNLSVLFKKGAKQGVDIEDDDNRGKSGVDKGVKAKSPKEDKKEKQTSGRKRKSKDEQQKEGKSDEGKASKRKKSVTLKSREQNHSVFTLSSDSESPPHNSPIIKDDAPDEVLSALVENECTRSEKDKDDIIVANDVASAASEDIKGKSPSTYRRKKDEKSSKKTGVRRSIRGENEDSVDISKEDTLETCDAPHVSSSRLPLVLSEKVQRTKALVECEGDSIDLSGDVGAVGRVVISDDTTRKNEMLMDLKGTVYKTTIVPSRTFCVVSFGPSEAKIEAIMNDFIQLTPQSNIYEAETMVEGTLDGFSFDSEDEADNLPKATAPTDQDEASEEQPNGKTKRNTAKKSGIERKKSKAAAGKPPKNVKKKPQATKKTKTKK